MIGNYCKKICDFAKKSNFQIHISLQHKWENHWYLILIIWSDRIHSFKYLRFTTSGCKEIRIIKNQSFCLIKISKRFKGYRCVLGISLLKCKDTWNYAYSPFIIFVSVFINFGLIKLEYFVIFYQFVLFV